METRLNIYYGLIGMVVAVCYCYGLYWVIAPMVAKSESWITIFMMSGITTAVISLALALLAFCLGPFIALAFFATEGFFRFLFWTIRRIRALSVRPLP
ncbi:hypothetical protein AAH678_04080 [Sodalis endosymbiont of Spalangia cameroni]|uniref:hypothetical protein n=1 Tax=Sodalis praecaptivus TaxID=1239307 RepID=UPI0031F74C32